MGRDYVGEHEFVLIIQAHGHPYNCDTYDTITNKNHYTGDYIFIVDDEDKTLPEYQKRFGDKVYVFNKDEVAKNFDLMDNSSPNRSKACVVYARNYAFDIAKQLGYKYFCEMDDDTIFFFMRWIKGNGMGRHNYYGSWEKVFNAYIDWLECSPVIQCVALPQGGDVVGGASSALIKNGYRRKCMNSQIFRTDDRAYFIGRLNEDVNAYVGDCDRDGRVFITAFDNAGILLDQRVTQSGGGMSDSYAAGTYLKSFYSVMLRPDAVKIDVMGGTHMRIHHKVSSNVCHPKIISGRYKK